MNEKFFILKVQNGTWAKVKHNVSNKRLERPTNFVVTHTIQK